MRRFCKPEIVSSILTLGFYIEDVMFLNVLYDEYSSGGEVCKEDEGTKWPNYEPTYIDVRLRDLVISNESSLRGESIEIDFDPLDYVGKKLYLVFVRYTTGGTFGYSTGNPCFPDCCINLKEAKKIEAKIREGKWNGDSPWKGYFEKLDSVEVCPMILSVSK